jgi:peroxiredoxin
VPKRSISLLIGGAVLVGAAVAGIAAMDSPDSRNGYRTTKDGTLAIDADMRSEAPSFTGTTLDGKTTGLTDFKGKTVIVNAWASWCTACRIETPLLIDYYKAHRKDGIAILGLNQDASPTAGRAFAGEYKMPYPSLSDPSGKQLLGLPKGVINTRGLPVTFVIDSHGKVAASAAGEVTASVLDTMIETAKTQTAPTR